jgi:hypothetical protein
MARKKYIPSKRDLSKAWTVKKAGGKKRDICKRLGITIKQYEMHTQTFNEHFRRESLKLKHDIDSVKSVRSTTKRKAPAYYKGEKKLTPENIDFDALNSYIVLGYNKDTIAKLLGVSRSCYFDFLKRHPDIQRFVDTATERTMDDIYRNGLLLLCKEHKLPDTHFASYQGNITSVPIKKHFNPDVTALKYMFANKLGWATEPRPERTDNRGVILKMLDDICNGEEDQDQDHTPTKEKK